MKYELDIAPRVDREIARIYLYRERERLSGERFIKALHECYDQVLLNPYSYQVRKDPFRHAQLHRLKYRVVYKVEGQLISVVQVRHTSRRVSTQFGP